MARRRCNRVLRGAAGVLGAAALAFTAMTPGASRPAVAGDPVAAVTPAAVTPAEVTPAAAAAPEGGTTVVAGAAAASRGCSPTLDVVAHEDDDLLFINPSVSDDIAAGRCVVTLFVTAGDSGRPPSYWLRREQGAMAAYAAMAGTAPAWDADTIALAGHPVVRRRLAGTSITLLFLRLPDAHGSPARAFGTLQALWRGEIPSLRPLGSGGAYTRKSLVATLAAAMEAYQPERIRTLDYAGHYGDGDHADHHTVGYLTFAAQRSYRAHHTISGYRGYTVADYPANLGDDAAGRKLDYFLAYAPYDSKVCQTAEACLTNFYSPRFTHSLTTATSLR